MFQLTLVRRFISGRAICWPTPMTMQPMAQTRGDVRWINAINRHVGSTVLSYDNASHQPTLEGAIVCKQKNNVAAWILCAGGRSLNLVVKTGSALCSPVPMFPGTYVPRYRCSPIFVH